MIYLIVLFTMNGQIEFNANHFKTKSACMLELKDQVKMPLHKYVYKKARCIEFKLK